jgi:lipopolysaccharide transport system ATP-binding protein
MGTIAVHGLGKAYKKYPNRWARVREWLWSGGRVHHEASWVLRDINFEVRSGEAVGIIGMNGAGKSTLLKLITGTTQATAGRIEITGRVAALLELGMGFHPDFTGRQNVYMSGQLLGLSADEVSASMGQILDFAEIGEAVDQPVRVYSSGMQMRLAFSVATVRRPDVLIVDEALSVGDAYFQHKSFDRIRAFREQGTTLLMVSHDKQAIQSICDRAILLSAGRLAMEGEPEAVMDAYNALLTQQPKHLLRQERQADGKVQTISGSAQVTLGDFALTDEEAQPIDVVGVGQAVVLRVRAHVHSGVKSLVMGYMIKDRLGQAIFGTNTFHHDCVAEHLSEGQSVEFLVKFNVNLGPGTYSIALALHEGVTHVSNNYEWRDRALVFNVVNLRHRDFVGLSWLPPQVEVRS